MIICDNPPFEGGQITGASYVVEFTTQTYIRNAEGVLLDRGLSEYTRANGLAPYVTGKITSVSVETQYDPNGGGSKGVVIRHGGPPIDFLTRYFTNGNLDAYIVELKSVNIERFVSGVGWTKEGDVSIPNCRCSDDSCRVECPTTPLGFCCIPHALTNALQEVLNN